VPRELSEFCVESDRSMSIKSGTYMGKESWSVIIFTDMYPLDWYL
jgi:hypothetical protein